MGGMAESRTQNMNEKMKMLIKLDGLFQKMYNDYLKKDMHHTTDILQLDKSLRKIIERCIPLATELGVDISCQLAAYEKIQDSFRSAVRYETAKEQDMCFICDNIKTNAVTYCCKKYMCLKCCHKWQNSTCPFCRKDNLLFK
jgi:hypothetical protein